MVSRKRLYYRNQEVSKIISRLNRWALSYGGRDYDKITQLRQQAFELQLPFEFQLRLYILEIYMLIEHVFPPDKHREWKGSREQSAMMKNKSQEKERQRRLASEEFEDAIRE